MHRAIVSGKVADEAVHDVVTQPETPEHVQHVEHVPRMLTIHRRHQLAAVDLRRIQHGQLQVGREKLSRRGDEWLLRHREHRPAKHEVDFDFDLGRPIRDEHLGLLATTRGEKGRSQSSPL